jgi:hypothetical protein
MMPIVLIAALAASVFTLSIGSYWVHATVYDAMVGSPGPDTFCYCIHMGTYNQPDDTWVTLGMQGNYDTSNPYSYEYCYWSFDAGVGGNYDHDFWFFGAPRCTYAYDQYGYWSGDQYYAPGEPQQIGDRWYWDTTNYTSPNPSAHKMSGETYAAFYKEPDWSEVRYIAAQPNPIDELTAHAPPIVPHYWEG